MTSFSRPGAALLLALAAGCGSPKTPLSLSIHWQGAVSPVPAGAQLTVELLDHSQPNALFAAGQSAPLPFAAGGVTASFPAISGSGLTALVTVRASASPLSPALFDGVSSAFSVAASAKSATVTIALQPLPSGLGVQVSTATPGHTNQTSVDLLLAAPGASAVAVANTPAGLDTAPVVELTSLKQSEAGLYLLSGWALNSGLPPDPGGCDVATAAEGCQRTVYARFFDPRGVAAEVVTASVVLDLVPPALLAPSVTAAAGPGQTLVLELIPSEPLAAPPALAVTPTLEFQLVPGSGYQFVHPVTAADSGGAYTVTATLTDLAGNVATPPALPFAIDESQLAVSGVQTDRGTYSAQPGFNLITLTFDTSAAPGGAVGAVMDGQSFACSEFSPAPPNYTCLYTVTGSETEGEEAILISAADAAGDQALAAAAVTLDFTPPALTAMAASPDYVAPGEQEQLSFSFTKPLGVLPVLAVEGPGSLDFQAQTPNEFITVVPAGTALGSYSTSLQIVDLVGNGATVTGPVFTVEP